MKFFAQRFWSVFVSFLCPFIIAFFVIQVLSGSHPFGWSIDILILFVILFNLPIILTEVYRSHNRLRRFLNSFLAFIATDMCLFLALVPGFSHSLADLVMAVLFILIVFLDVFVHFRENSTIDDDDVYIHLVIHHGPQDEQSEEQPVAEEPTAEEVAE